MVTKEILHRVIDTLPDSELEAAARLLAGLGIDDPVLRAVLAAPIDDEPETPEEAAAVQQARDDLAAGRVVSHEEARRRLLGEP
ncbi:MAG TPA: hypothetical protein VFE37_10475 [Chloroflexota bacterium]|nr:hypothetical protein [Chloroflexota bacterium]